MQTGLDNMDLSHCNSQKKAVTDTVALWETRIMGSGPLEEKNYTFLWRGLNADQHRLCGVGFVIRSSLVWSISTPMGISE